MKILAIFVLAIIVPMLAQSLAVYLLSSLLQ
jgi:hypothetical protein